MAKSFTASVKGWSQKALRNAGVIAMQSTHDVVNEAQKPVAKGGRMPVITGTLRGSLQSSLLGSTSLKGPESYVATVATMRPGDVAEFTWGHGIRYARKVEHGSNGRPGRMFAGGAVAQWDAIVQRNAARVKD